MQISGVSLALTWPSRLCLLRVLCTMLLLQPFPFPSTLGKVTLLPRCQACVFVYSSHGRWVFPPLLWSFPPSATLTSFPAPGCWVHTPAPTLSSLARPDLFIYNSRRDSSPLLFGTQGTPPSLLCVFIVLIAYYSVSLFSPGGGRSVQGAMLTWPRDVCGSTEYHLAHLVVHVFPSHLGTGNWRRPRGPPGFSIQCEVEMLCTGWRCGGVKVLPLLGGLACKVCLQHLSKMSL
jgi:hypothetical protein